MTDYDADDLDLGDDEAAADTGGVELRDDGQPLGTRRNYDWPAIKKTYVEGTKLPDRHDWPSLEAVALQFGVPSNRVREKSAQQGWRAERTQWQHQLEQTRRQARAAAMTQEATNLDNHALTAAKTGLQLCQARLVEIGQAAQAARAGSNPGAPSSGGAIDALEMTRLGQAVDLFHKIGLRAVGDPETHRVELTGANGAPIEIAAELKRDDPTRIANVLNVLAVAGLGDIFGGAADAGRTLAAGSGGDGVPPAPGARG